MLMLEEKKDLLIKGGIVLVVLLIVGVFISLGVSQCTAQQEQEMQALLEQKDQEYQEKLKEQQDKIDEQKLKEEAEKERAKEFFDSSKPAQENQAFSILNSKYGISVTNEYSEIIINELKFLEYLSETNWVSSSGNKLIANPNYGKLTVIAKDGARVADIRFTPIQYEENKEGKVLTVSGENGSQFTLIVRKGEGGKTQVGGTLLDTVYYADGTRKVEEPIIEPYPGNLMDLLKLETFNINEKLETYFMGQAEIPKKITVENQLFLNPVPTTARLKASSDVKDHPLVAININLINGEITVNSDSMPVDQADNGEGLSDMQKSNEGIVGGEAQSKNPFSPESQNATQK